MAEKIALTQAGYNKLQAEYRDLIDNVREDVKKQIVEARAQGDLSENADFDAARKKQAEVEARIAEIQSILDNCIITEGSKKHTKVALGSKVTIKFVEGGKEVCYSIVGTIESDPFNNKISNASPLGGSLIGKSVGDVVEVKGAKAPYKVEVLKIENL